MKRRKQTAQGKIVGGVAGIVILLALCGSCLPDSDEGDTPAEPTTAVQPLLDIPEEEPQVEATEVPPTEAAVPTDTDEPPTATDEPTDEPPAATDVPPTDPPAPTEAQPTVAPPPTEAAPPPAQSGAVSDLSERPPDAEPWLPCARGQIKGNRNTMIFHVPGGSHYQRTFKNVWCFNSADEARAAGYVQSGN